MQNTAIDSSTLTRRKFLQTTGVAAGAVTLGTLAGCAPQGSSDEENGSESGITEVEEQVYFQTCGGNCTANGCPLLVHVREGKVSNITKPDLKYPDGSKYRFSEICVKGYTNIERMYGEARIQYPMRRVEGSARGAGEWERISWDEAIDLVATKWKELRAEYGPESVAFTFGSGATHSVTGGSGGWHIRLRTLLGATIVNNCYDNTGIFTMMDYFGRNPLFAVCGDCEPRNILYADNIFLLGSNPTESNPTVYNFISEAQENGAKLVVIDPKFNIVASKADMFVPIRPATDGLLAAGMLKIAIRDGNIDKAGLQTLSVAPCLIKDSDGLYLRLSDINQAEAGSEEDSILVYEAGRIVALNEATNPEIEGVFEIEGIAVKTAYQVLLERLDEWTLEAISDYTDLSLETIEELAALYVSGNTIMVGGFGLDHYSNGQTAYDAMCALASVTGQVGKPGVGIAFPSLSFMRAQGVIPTTTQGLEEFKPGFATYYPYFPQLMKDGFLGVEGAAAFVPAAPKALFIFSGNPVGCATARTEWLEAFETLEQVVVVDIFMSQTAQVADILLPASFLFEHNDLMRDSFPFVRIAEKAVDPLFESKNDFEIITLLGSAMGFEDYFTQDLDGYIESCLDNDVARDAGITYDRLIEEHAIWSYPEEPVFTGSHSPIATKTGRLEFYHEGIKPQADIGQEWDGIKESCWFWEPPLEAWHENELFEAYPMLLLTERSKFRTHSMFNDIPMLLELDPEPIIRINQMDAEARNLLEGDMARVFNDRGSMVLKVAIDAGCRQGVIMTDHGWEADDFAEGHYNDLTTLATWPRFAQDNWFDCLCQIEKIQ